MSVVIIVLNSLVSEGTPRMALDMCRRWLSRGITPVILLIDAEKDELRTNFDAIGVQIVSAGLPKRGYRRFFGLVTSTRRLVRTTGARGVVSMLFGWHAFIAMGASSAGARTVAHVGNHPIGLDPSTKRKLGIMIRLGRPFTHRLICCSAYVRDGAAAAFTLSPETMDVVYNGVALDAFAKAPRAVVPSGPLVITMVARLEIHKDQSTLIRAVALLRDRKIPVRLNLVGNGTRRAELEALAASVDAADIVHFLGVRDDVAAILAQSQVFAFSTTPDEGLGIALIEAMVAGVPIVASDVGACRETLDAGRCGLLVPPGDPQALADGIIAIQADVAASQERACAGKERAFTHFDAKAMADRYLELVNA